MTNVNSDSRMAESKRLQTEFAARDLDLDIGGGNERGGGGGGSAADAGYDVDAPPLPFDSADQKVFLVNFAHRQQQPRCKVPAFRVLGAFPNKDALLRHVKSVGGPDAFGGAALHVVEGHKKALVCSSLDKQKNADYVMQKIDESTRLYANMLDFHTKEFTENRQKKQQGKTGLSQKEKTNSKSSRQLLLEEKFNEFMATGQQAGVVSRMAEVRNQSFVVASVIEDMTPAVIKGMEDPEPIVILWHCFDSEPEAKRYILSTAQERVRDISMDIYNMYEWIYPTEINVDSVNEQFRDPRLDKIMKARKRTKTNVKNFEQWCASEGKQAPVLEIDATAPEETKVKPIELGSTMQVSTAGVPFDQQKPEKPATAAATETKDFEESSAPVAPIDISKLDFKPVSGRIESNKYHSTTFVEDGLTPLYANTAKEVEITVDKPVRILGKEEEKKQ